MKTAIKIVLSTVALVTGLAFLFAVQHVAYTEKAFVCENSGSRMGYREWFNSARTDAWHEKSAVETFMQTRYPAQFTNRWTSYMGTGHSIYGHRLSYGHGRPGPIKGVKTEVLNAWFKTLPDSDKKAFYDLLVGNDTKVIGAKAMTISDWYFENAEKENR